MILVTYLPDSFYLASRHAGWTPPMTKPMWLSSIETSGSRQLAVNARGLGKLSVEVHFYVLDNYER